ncbi:MAG: sulfite exporter TauE/SafE family protein [Gammaproteobacteria bacterium]|nr:MAG: sulfite exporter TauE/SafE family protein [Gammaproteobacteria bacterium]|tara:strand:+ start:52 stop:804 length:753 start_codon:yes stop_codon:yes gene_type:complete
MELDLILVVILAATFATAFLSSIFGMLGGLILMGILISFLPVGPAMVLHGLIQTTSNGYRAWLNRADINWKIVLTLLIGSSISLIILFFIAFQPSQILVIFALGLLPFIAWAVPKELSLDVTKPPIGVLAGGVVVGTNLIAGVGGPLLDIFFQRVEMTRHQVVATKAVAQTIGHISKIIFFGGLLVSFNTENWPNLTFLIFAIILSVIGTTLGKKVLDIIDDAIFFRWTQLIVLSVGGIFIIRGLFLLTQ